MPTDYNYLFKTIIVGDNGVGKSSIIRTYIEDTFVINYNSTIGIDFHIKVVEHDNKKIKIHIWDTAGTERFKTIVRSYYKDCIGCVVVFDITNRTSFDNVHKWVEDVYTHTNTNKKMEFILVGNKCDLMDRQVAYNEGHDLALQYNMIYIETSAKNRYNIDSVYQRLTECIYDKIISGEIKLDNNIISLRKRFSILDDDDFRGGYEDEEEHQRKKLRKLFNCC